MVPRRLTSPIVNIANYIQTKLRFMPNRRHLFSSTKIISSGKLSGEGILERPVQADKLEYQKL